MVILTNEDADYIAMQLRDVQERRTKGAESALKQAKEIKDAALAFMGEDEITKDIIDSYNDCVNGIKCEYEKDKLMIIKCLELLLEGSIKGGKN